MDVRKTARALAKSEARVAPARLVRVFDEAISYYRHVDAIWEPLEQAKRALQRFSRRPTAPPWVPSSGERLSQAGNPQTRGFTRRARTALMPFLDEDQQTEILRLVGLLP